MNVMHVSIQAMNELSKKIQEALHNQWLAGCIAHSESVSINLQRIVFGKIWTPLVAQPRYQLNYTILHRLHSFAKTDINHIMSIPVAKMLSQDD